MINKEEQNTLKTTYILGKELYGSYLDYDYTRLGLDSFTFTLAHNSKSNLVIFLGSLEREACSTSPAS